MIDVILLTKDSEYVLEKCLDALYGNVPVKRLMVIDANSKDRTLDIVIKYPNVEIVGEKPTCRGIARQIGIDNVTTDWFAFIDSDVVLCDKWFEKMKLFMSQNVGAIFGVDLPRPLSGFRLRFMQMSSARVFQVRGGCHDILIRKKAVEDISIPSNLHTLEDAYIKEWIERQWKVIVNYEACCYHYKGKRSFVSKESIISTVKEFRKFGLVKDRLIFGWIFTLMSLLERAQKVSPT